ncbi:hypothetical protein M444_04200 [Streptomyces sp. Mg1]|nr:hypothetical protein M444_04200 [Streptomyces sp. Mg1]
MRSGPVSRSRWERSRRTVRSTRAFSVTTCRARARSTGSCRTFSCATDSMSRSASTPMSTAASSHSRRRAAYSPSARACLVPVSMTRRRRPAAARSSGSCARARERVSRKRACPGVQHMEAIWSITPHGTPTKAFSARWASRAVSGAVSAIPYRARSAVATAHSRAAEEDSPAPGGTSPSMRSSAPPTRCPAPRRAQATPAAYADQPPGAPAAPGRSAVRS